MAEVASGQWLVASKSGEARLPGQPEYRSGGDSACKVAFPAGRRGSHHRWGQVHGSHQHGGAQKSV